MTPRQIEYYRRYGHRLRVTRLVLGISQADAATAHGVSVRTYLRWDSGAKPRSTELGCNPRVDSSCDISATTIILNIYVALHARVFRSARNNGAAKMQKYVLVSNHPNQSETVHVSSCVHLGVEPLLQTISADRQAFDDGLDAMAAAR